MSVWLLGSLRVCVRSRRRVSFFSFNSVRLDGGGWKIGRGFWFGDGS